MIIRLKILQKNWRNNMDSGIIAMIILTILAVIAFSYSTYTTISD